MDNKQARDWHRMLDRLAEGKTLSPQNVESLRELLPELPKQKTLEEIVHEVYEAWIASSGDEWIRDGVVGSVISLEDWLKELHEQLKGLKDTSAVFPALPDGMRIAEHVNFGRVVVSPGVGVDKCHEIFYLDPGMASGTDISVVESDSLTFIDTESAAPAHPEFLETEEDYQNAPEGTIVACEDSSPWHKTDSAWLSTTIYGGNRAKSMAGVTRRVLRWGWGE